MRGGVAVEGVRELRDGRRDFETHVEDLALALEADVLGPFHHARQVAAWLDVLANTEVARFALEEWVLPWSTYTWDMGTVMGKLTLLACFLLEPPALLAGNGAGAALLPDFGGCH